MSREIDYATKEEKWTFKKVKTATSNNTDYLGSRLRLMNY